MKKIIPLVDKNKIFYLHSNLSKIKYNKLHIIIDKDVLIHILETVFLNL